MLNSSRGRRQTNRGFSLTELAVVFVIVSFLIGGAMMTLSAQIEQRNNDETTRRLNAAVDAVIAFAIVNGRLPCPARYASAASNSVGQESFCNAATGTCAGGETLTVQTHGNCSNFYDGYLPAASIGVTPVDNSGFAVDSWGNRIRYAVARDFLAPPLSCGTVTTVPPAPPANTRIWTSQGNLKSYGVSCKPSDLDICATSVGATATSCNTALRVVTSNTAGFVVFSTGKNGSLPSSYGADELENADTDPVFVSHAPSGTSATGGYYDDIMVFVPMGVVYSKLISAGVLP